MCRIAPQLSGYRAGKVCLFVGKSPEHFKDALAGFMERTLGGGFFFFSFLKLRFTAVLTKPSSPLRVENEGVSDGGCRTLVR